MQASTGEEMHSKRLFTLFSLFSMALFANSLSSVVHSPSRSKPITTGKLFSSRSTSNARTPML
jgi:hypothetical protein